MSHFEIFEPYKPKIWFNHIMRNNANIGIAHQSGAAEAWWAHNPQVPGSKPGSDNFGCSFCAINFVTAQQLIA